jgi:hypothetical protein
VTLALERADQQVDEQTSLTLTLTLDDLMLEIKRIVIESDRMDRVLADRGLEMIVGEDLSSVTFVMDYLQLDFNCQSLSAYTLPSVRRGDKAFQPMSEGYRDVLCSLIGTTVDGIDVREQDAIDIRFREGSIVSISLRTEDAIGPESATFSSRAGGCWVW